MFNFSQISYSYIHFTEGNINILKNDSNNLSEQLIHSNDINECLKSEIDGKIDNELEPSNNINYM